MRSSHFPLPSLPPSPFRPATFAFFFVRCPRHGLWGRGPISHPVLRREREIVNLAMALGAAATAASAQLSPVLYSYSTVRYHPIPNKHKCVNYHHHYHQHPTHTTPQILAPLAATSPPRPQFWPQAAATAALSPILARASVSAPASVARQGTRSVCMLASITITIRHPHTHTHTPLDHNDINF